MKIPVERKVSAYNVKKKEKNGQIELLCLKTAILKIICCYGY